MCQRVLELSFLQLRIRHMSGMWLSLVRSGLGSGLWQMDCANWMVLDRPPLLLVMLAEVLIGPCASLSQTISQYLQSTVLATNLICYCMQCAQAQAAQCRCGLAECLHVGCLPRADLCA